ncbi:hypothetical protein DIURU_005201 [Diutina rugosa]|uniref:LsmAD domain-containing protein n=1 Tax=Diutina rugosa TaxID=5481 RepID=A0A642UEB3_DIURU|nr:uncharacterized protein DIURU_005201 [Diutina rugosa]KAA8897485.1 hypothetical protein DIURU_005201 [Diutina rugosa]
MDLFNDPSIITVAGASRTLDAGPSAAASAGEPPAQVSIPPGLQHVFQSVASSSESPELSVSSSIRRYQYTVDELMELRHSAEIPDMSAQLPDKSFWRKKAPEFKRKKRQDPPTQASAQSQHQSTQPWERGERHDRRHPRSNLDSLSADKISKLLGENPNEQEPEWDVSLEESSSTAFNMGSTVEDFEKWKQLMRQEELRKAGIEVDSVAESSQFAEEAEHKANEVDTFFSFVKPTESKPTAKATTTPASEGRSSRFSSFFTGAANNQSANSPKPASPETQATAAAAAVGGHSRFFGSAPQQPSPAPQFARSSSSSSTIVPPPGLPHPMAKQSSSGDIPQSHPQHQQQQHQQQQQQQQQVPQGPPQSQQPPQAQQGSQQQAQGRHPQGHQGHPGPQGPPGMPPPGLMGIPPQLMMAPGPPVPHQQSQQNDSFFMSLLNKKDRDGSEPNSAASTPQQAKPSVDNNNTHKPPQLQTNPGPIYPGQSPSTQQFQQGQQQSQGPQQPQGPPGLPHGPQGHQGPPGSAQGRPVPYPGHAPGHGPNGMVIPPWMKQQFSRGPMGPGGPQGMPFPPPQHPGGPNQVPQGHAPPGIGHPGMMPNGMPLPPGMAMPQRGMPFPPPQYMGMPPNMPPQVRQMSGGQHPMPAQGQPSTDQSANQ